jgi:hypothetical protein
MKKAKIIERQLFFIGSLHFLWAAIGDVVKKRFYLYRQCKDFTTGVFPEKAVFLTCPVLALVSVHFPPPVDPPAIWLLLSPYPKNLRATP